MVPLSRTRYVLLCLVLVASGACGPPGPHAPPAHYDRTNVLWMTICTLRADHLGAYGYAEPTSPHIDALAERSFLFERALTQAPWTRPSVASMVTSIYPRSLDIEPKRRRDDRQLHESFETAAEIFRKAGYYTIGITANPNANPVFNFDQGYDYYVGTRKRWNGGYAKNKLDARQVLRLLLTHLRGPARGSKFFAHVVLVDTHNPYVRRDGVGPRTGLLKNVSIESYDDQIRYVDEMLSRLLAKLEQMGLGDTILVINSDHGEGFGEAGRMDVAHGGTLYESVLWVPLIVHHPGFQSRARRIREPIENVDILPTLLGLLGIPFEASAFDGISHAEALLTGGDIASRDVAVVETAYDQVRRSALLSDGWKLIVDYEPKGKPASTPKLELFRIDEDPLQGNDLAASEPERARGMFRRLTEWQEARALPPPEVERSNPAPDEIEALRALGYLESEEEAGGAGHRPEARF